MTPRIRLVALALPSLVLALCGGCESIDLGAVTTASDSGVPSQETIARYNDPIAASQLRERAMDELGRLIVAPVPEVRANAIEGMLTTPTRLEPFIPAALKDENQGVRSTAALMVGEAGLADLAPAVRPLLNDPSPFVRASAVYALARNGQQVDQTPLAEIILGDPNPRARAHAAFIIGKLGDSSARGLLHDAAATDIPRAEAVARKMFTLQVSEALVRLGEEEQIEPIRAALYPSKPQDLEVTALATQIIGELRDRGAASELIILTAMKGEGRKMPAEIRLGAAASMAKLGNTRGSFIADEFLNSEAPALRAQAAYVYGETGRRENLAKLEMLLQDPESRVRVAAAAAIVKATSRRTH